VVYSKSVYTDSVDSGDVALVFHSAGGKQRSPSGFTGFRPIGQNKQAVVGRTPIGIQGVAKPNRESQVKANRKAQAPSAPGNHHGVFTAAKVLVLARYRKKVALVCGAGASVGLHPKKAVGHFARLVRSKDRGPHGAVKFRGKSRQKLHGLSALGCNLSGVLRGKSRGKCLGQKQDVYLAALGQKGAN
jgi:hypothetical protein